MIRSTRREEAYHAVDTERDYQDRLPISRTDGDYKTVGDYVTMLGHYHTKMVAAWTECPGNDAALEVMRKCAGIAVHCMEDHGAPVRKIPVHKPQDPVHFRPSGTWWHTDETWSDEYGPFDTEDEARMALDAYALGLERGEDVAALYASEVSKETDGGADKAGFKDGAKLEWLDVSDEVWRQYVYPNGDRFLVEGPLELNVKKKPDGDSHRIKCEAPDGYKTSVYVASGWIAIEWKVKEGAEPFKF